MTRPSSGDDDWVDPRSDAEIDEAYRKANEALAMIDERHMMTFREIKWRIAGSLFVLSLVVIWLGLQPHAPEWAHVIGFLALIYLVCFITVAPIVSLAYEPPHIGPNTERSGFDG